MRIQDEHLYHGAALNQIAEHKEFTAINAFKLKGKTSGSAFRINDSAVVYLKYAKAPNKSYSEYQFTFSEQQLAELNAISEIEENLFLALICVKDKEICCITFAEFVELLEARRNAARRFASQFVLLVTLKAGQAFRAYVNKPGTKGQYLSPQKKIRRNRFPEILVK